MIAAILDAVFGALGIHSPGLWAYAYLVLMLAAIGTGGVAVAYAMHILEDRP